MDGKENISTGADCVNVCAKYARRCWFISFGEESELLFFAFAGYGVIANAAGNVENPKRTITLAIYTTLAVVMLFIYNIFW